MRIRQRQLLIGEILNEPGRFFQFRRVEWSYGEREQRVDETQKLDGTVLVVTSSFMITEAEQRVRARRVRAGPPELI